MVRVRRRRPEELDVARDDARGGASEAEVLGLVQRFAIHGEVRREADAPVGPGRLRVELLDEHQPFREGRHGRLEREARRAPNLLGEDRKSTRLNSSHVRISYAAFCLKKKEQTLTLLD